MDIMQLEKDKKHLQNLVDRALKCEDDDVVEIDAYTIGSITRILKYVEKLENKFLYKK